MSFDNAYFTTTYYVITAEHDLRVRTSDRGETPRRSGRRAKRRAA